MPKRKSKIGKKVALGIGIALLAVVVVCLIIKRETIWNLLNFSQIEMRPADEMRTIVREGDYTILTDTGDELSYTASDGAVTVQVLTEGDTITRMEAEFNAYAFDVNTVSEAEKYARDLLSPYYTEPQIEALVFVIASDIAPSLNATSINYTREIGAFSLNASAQILDGDVEVKMTRGGAED